MKRLPVAVTSLIGLLTGWALADGPGAAFRLPPRTAATDAGVEVRFQAAAPCDVAVWVQDKAGRTVRHLAAGLLGDNAPAPLTPGTLAQTLIWDRRDDVGRPVPAGDYTVQVGLGLSPSLKGLANFEPLNFGSVLGVQSLGEGRTCLFGLGGYPDFVPRLVVVDRDGRYVCQIYPPPGRLDPSASPGLPCFRRGDGQAVPLLAEVMPRPRGAAQLGPMALAAGRLFVCPFTSGPIVVIDPSSGAIAKPLGDGTIGLGKGRIAVRGLTASPDGKWLYFTGVRADPANEKASRALHAVYRLSADGSGDPAPFAGVPETAGGDDARLDTPIGLAVDGDGNVVVCDNGNGRVLVFSAAGKLLWQAAAKGALWVAVSGGEAFVVCTDAPAAASRNPAAVKPRLVVLSREGRELASAAIGAIPRAQGLTLTGIAAQPDGDGVAVCVARQGSLYPMSAGGVARFLWSGGELKEAAPIVTNFVRRQDKGPYDPRYMYNWEGGYVGYGEAFDWGYLPDEGELFYAPGPVSRDGLWADGRRYAWNRGWNWWKLKKADIAWLRTNADKSPAPFEATGSNGLGLAYEPRSPWFAQRGTFVDRRGHIYMRYSYDYPPARERKLDPRNEWHTGIMHYDADGRKVGELHLGHATYGFGVDVRGNIFVGEKIRPAGALVPADVERAFDGKTPESVVRWYGSIIAFGPEGGEIVYSRGAPGEADAVARTDGDLFRRMPAVLDGDVQQTSGGIPHYTARLSGARWMWVGYSPEVSTAACICYATSFATDPFGRCYVPDRIACRVAVLDANGNLVRYVGGYGNMDSRGAGSPVPDPPIAFAGIRMVTAATSRQFRVADNVNGWVSIIDLAYREQAAAPATVK
ncbi:MAG: hypothetical protein BIFFINMI_00071 [Phycisphaerae bacterium]|nr:hypothetical protein [Phycisphaerae bacterium]